jgi:large subunit ribosomal protein L35
LRGREKLLRSEGVPKLKTNRGAAKRFRKTSSGKVRRSRAFANHILTKKSTKRKRNLRTSTFVDKTNSKAIRKLIPYA